MLLKQYLEMCGVISQKSRKEKEDQGKVKNKKEQDNYNKSKDGKERNLYNKKMS